MVTRSSLSAVYTPTVIIWIIVTTAILGAVALAVLPLTAIFGAALIVVVVAGTLLEPGIGLIVTLIAAPWAAWMNTYYPGLLPIDAGQILVGFTLGTWVLSGLAKREFVIPESPILIPLLLFVGWASVTILWAPNLTFALPEVIKWVEMILVMLLAIDVARRRGISWILIAVFSTATLQALIGIYEAHVRGIGPLGFRLSEGVYRAYGTFEQPNPFAGFVGLVLPIAIALTAYSLLQIGRRIVQNKHGSFSRAGLQFITYAIITILLTAALYLSFSRGAWLAAVAAVGALIVFAPRRLWLGIGLVMIAVFALTSLASAELLPASIGERLADAGDILQIRDVRGVPINDANYALIERQAHWQAALNMLTDQPWTGVGFGNYQAVYDQYRLLNWPMALGHAHNIYLNVAAETGVIGLILYLFLWSTVFVLTFRTIRSAHGLQRALAVGLMGTWVYLSTHMLVDNLYVNNTHLIVGALLGLLVVIQGKKYTAETRSHGAKPLSSPQSAVSPRPVM